MELNKQIKIKSEINNLFESGINKINVYKLIERLLIENEVSQRDGNINVLIDGKSYKTTMNSFESNLLVSERQATGTYIIGKYFFTDFEYIKQKYL